MDAIRGLPSAEFKAIELAAVPSFARVDPLPGIDNRKAWAEVLGQTKTPSPPVVRAYYLCYLLLIEDHSNYPDIHSLTALWEGEEFFLVDELKRDIYPPTLFTSSPHHSVVKNAAVQWAFRWFEKHIAVRQKEFRHIPPPPKIHAHVLDWLIRASTLADLFEKLCRFGIEPHLHPLERQIPGVCSSFFGYFSTILAASPALHSLFEEWQRQVRFASQPPLRQIRSLEGFVAYAQLIALQTSLSRIFQETIDSEKLATHLAYMARLPCSTEVRNALLHKIFPTTTTQAILLHIQHREYEPLAKLLKESEVSERLERAIGTALKELQENYQ